MNAAPELEIFKLLLEDGSWVACIGPPLLGRRVLRVQVLGKEAFGNEPERTWAKGVLAFCRALSDEKLRGVGGACAGCRGKAYVETPLIGPEPCPLCGGCVPD